MRLSIGASFAWKQDDKALDHAISGEKASFKGLRSTERSLWSRVSDSNTLDTSDLRIWKSERTTICICMPLRATWCLPLSPLSLNLRLHLVDFLIQPEMKMQQAFWTFLSEAQRSSMIPWVPFCFFTFFGFHPYWLNAMAIREQPASKKSKPRGVCFSFQLGLATAASCMWYIILWEWTLIQECPIMFHDWAWIIRFQTKPTINASFEVLLLIYFPNSDIRIQDHKTVTSDPHLEVFEVTCEAIHNFVKLTRFFVHLSLVIFWFLHQQTRITET